MQYGEDEEDEESEDKDERELIICFLGCYQASEHERSKKQKRRGSQKKARCNLSES
jgi:hypothetical protein